MATGIYLAAFDYREYKGTGSKGDEGEKVAKSLVVSILGDSSAKAAVDRAKIICTGQNFARSIASRPANNINPPSLAKVSQAMAREAGLKCRVMDEKELARLGMGGILAVGAEHSDAAADDCAGTSAGECVGQTLLVVGKAITFDTGGISIKPADKMGKMILTSAGRWRCWG